jgi:phosphoribosylaminoimidazolecarboxamide formyltransferase/IMP cyclohydrolase
MGRKPVRTALISVYDKTGIEEFARRLVEMDWNLLASGGTARRLNECGLPVRDVADLVGGGAILGHRVVTLSREVHAGLLARDTEEDQAELDRLGIPRIDLVCVDLYPLMAAMSDENATDDSVRELTDIGGPTLLRSAAKGQRIVISQVKQREMVLQWLEMGCPGKDAVLRHLAAEAEAACTHYTLCSANYWSGGEIGGEVTHVERKLKYGENPWQKPAVLMNSQSDDPLALPNFKLLAGAPLGYCNYTDLDRMLQTMTHVVTGLRASALQERFVAVGVKHGNPCGASQTRVSGIKAIEKMVTGDRRAIFGGSVMVNFKMTLPRARALLKYGMPKGQRRKLDLLTAPSYTKTAQELLSKRGLRLMVNPALNFKDCEPLNTTSAWRQVRGGWLVQPNFTQVCQFNFDILPKSIDAGDLVLAWAVGATSNSNTICLVKNGMLIGNGCGQQDRVTAARHAVEKARDAGHDPLDAVAYSDSFFPFADALLTLEGRGVKTIVTCSGSINDEKVLATAQRFGLNMILFPHVEARGFYGH